MALVSNAGWYESIMLFIVSLLLGTLVGAVVIIASPPIVALTREYIASKTPTSDASKSHRVTSIRLGPCANVHCRSDVYLHQSFVETNGRLTHENCCLQSIQHQ